MTLEDHRAAMLLAPYGYRGPIPDHFQDDLHEAMIDDARRWGQRPLLPAMTQGNREGAHRPMTEKGRLAHEMAAEGASTAEIAEATGVNRNYARTLRRKAGFGNSPHPRSKSDDARDMLRAGKSRGAVVAATGLARNTVAKLAREVRT